MTTHTDSERGSQVVIILVIIAIGLLVHPFLAAVVAGVLAITGRARTAMIILGAVFLAYALAAHVSGPAGLALPA